MRRPRRWLILAAQVLGLALAMETAASKGAALDIGAITLDRGLRLELQVLSGS